MQFCRKMQKERGADRSSSFLMFASVTMTFWNETNSYRYNDNDYSLLGCVSVCWHSIDFPENWGIRLKFYVWLCILIFFGFSRWELSSERSKVWLCVWPDTTFWEGNKSEHWWVWLLLRYLPGAENNEVQRSTPKNWCSIIVSSEEAKPTY